MTALEEAIKNSIKALGTDTRLKIDVQSLVTYIAIIRKYANRINYSGTTYKYIERNREVASLNQLVYMIHHYNLLCGEIMQDCKFKLNPEYAEVLKRRKLTLYEFFLVVGP